MSAHVLLYLLKLVKRGKMLGSAENFITFSQQV